MTIQELINRICYSWYSIIHAEYRIIDKIFDWPFRHLIYPIPFVKRRWAKYGMKTFEDVQNWYGRNMETFEEFSLDYYSSTFTVAAPFMTLLILGNLIQYFGEVLPREYFKLSFIILGIGAWFSCYFTIWKNDIYIGYFRKFKEESRKKKTAWCIGTVILYILLTVVWFFSMSLIY